MLSHVHPRPTASPCDMEHGSRRVAAASEHGTKVQFRTWVTNVGWSEWVTGMLLWQSKDVNCRNEQWVSNQPYEGQVASCLTGGRLAADPAIPAWTPK